MFWNCNTRPELSRIKIIFSSSYSIRWNFYLCSRHYWNQVDFEAFNYGKFYAFVNDIPNCDSGTKSCHCANKAWLSLTKPRSSPEAVEILGKDIIFYNLLFFDKFRRIRTMVSRGYLSRTNFGMARSRSKYKYDDCKWIHLRH